MKLETTSKICKFHCAILASAVLVALICMGCGPSSSGSGRGGQGALGLVPDSVVFVQVVDMDEVLKDEEFLESKLPDSMIVRGFGDMEEQWDKDWGITAQDINAYVQTSDNVTIFEGLDGRIDFELIEDTLYESGYDEDDYRGYALWEVRGQTVAILEDDGYVIIGDSDDVKRYLRLLDQGEGSLLQDDENPLKRVLDRVGTGLLVKGSPNCDVQIEVRRCQAAAVSVSTNSESYTLEHTVVFLFGSERTAERHVEDFEDHLEKVQDSASSLEYQVTQDGEFIEVTASIDWDDLGNCKLLEALVGNECLITANVPTMEPAPRFTPAVGEGRTTQGQRVSQTNMRTEAMGYIPSSKAGKYIGQRGTVRGIVKDYQWISGRPGRPHLLLFDTGALIERGSPISEQEIPDTFTVIIWKEDALANFPSSTNFGPVYLDKVVCVTGTIEIDFGDRPSIRATHPDQLKADC